MNRPCPFLCCSVSVQAFVPVSVPLFLSLCSCPSVIVPVLFLILVPLFLSTYLLSLSQCPCHCLSVPGLFLVPAPINVLVPLSLFLCLFSCFSVLVPVLVPLFLSLHSSPCLYLRPSPYFLCPFPPCSWPCPSVPVPVPLFLPDRERDKGTETGTERQGQGWRDRDGGTLLHKMVPIECHTYYYGSILLSRRDFPCPHHNASPTDQTLTGGESGLWD